MATSDEKSLLPSRAPRRKSRSWCSERLLQLFDPAEIDSLTEEGMEYIRKRRVLDFLVLPGTVSAKLQDEQGKIHRIELSFEQFTDEQWSVVLETLAKEAYFLAMLLAGELPEEVDDSLGAAAINLCPGVFEDLEVVVNGVKSVRLNKQIAVVIYRLCEKLDEDPFAIFLLRGKGRDELLVEIRSARREILKTRKPKEGVLLSEREDSLTERPPVVAEKFWSMKSEVSELSYSLRADELPAAILKRLDPLPLGGLEDEVEPLLEESYAQIARRAQAYGLGLK